MDLKTLIEIPPWEWPEDAGKQIQSTLTNRKTKKDDRLLAAELAGEFVVTTDEMVECLLGILSNTEEPEDLQSRVANALGTGLEYADMMGFDDFDDIVITEKVFQKVQRSLKSLYFDSNVPTEVRQRILESSARAPEEWHSEAVREAYIDSDPEWRLSAVFAMRFVRGFEPEILESMNSEDPDIFFEALCAAGVWAVDDAWEQVHELVVSEDTEKSLRIAAIFSLAHIRPREGAVIISKLLDHRDEDIVDAAFEAMAESGEILADDELDTDPDDEDPILH